MMDRINRILSHPLWLQNMREIRKLEENRIFCRHNTEHLLDVARLAYIEILENSIAIPKELIYAAAMLHDIGRARQYTDGTPHHTAGAELAEQILPDCGFSHHEALEIISAIRAHRDSNSSGLTDLAGILYRADKASRMCMFCPARSQCNWSDEKKNMLLKR